MSSSLNKNCEENNSTSTTKKHPCRIIMLVNDESSHLISGKFEFFEVDDSILIFWIIIIFDVLH